MALRCFVSTFAGSCLLPAAVFAQGLYVPAPFPEDTAPRPGYRQRLNQFPPPGGRLGGGPLEYIATGGRPVPVAPDYAASVLPNFVDRPYAQPGDRRSDYGGVAAGPTRSYPGPAVAPGPVAPLAHGTYGYRADVSGPEYRKHRRLPKGGLPPFQDGGAGQASVPRTDALAGYDALADQPTDFSQPNDFSGLTDMFGGAQDRAPSPAAYAVPSPAEPQLFTLPLPGFQTEGLQPFGLGAPVDAAPVRPVARQGAADPIYQRQTVAYEGREAPGTIVIDTPDKHLYLVQRGGTAIRYGIGVGRPGFTWAGQKTISRKAEWPGWTPPSQMLKRRPDLPRHMVGGEGNPLGARAMYLGSSMYRIHGTNEPDSIGTNVSSGCIRMMNGDVIDLYDRVQVGTRVKVL